MAEKISIIQQIFDVRDRYRELKEVIDSDINPEDKKSSIMFFHDLLEIRRELACLTMDLAKETAKRFRKFKDADTALDIKKYLLTKKYMEEDGEKVTSAESKAKQNTTDLLRIASDEEGFYQTGKLILAQANELLASVKQDISIIRKDYEGFGDRSDGLYS